MCTKQILGVILMIAEKSIKEYGKLTNSDWDAIGLQFINCLKVKIPNYNLDSFTSLSEFAQRYFEGRNEKLENVNDVLISLMLFDYIYFNIKEIINVDSLKRRFNNLDDDITAFERLDHNLIIHCFSLFEGCKFKFEETKLFKENAKKHRVTLFEYFLLKRTPLSNGSLLVKKILDTNAIVMYLLPSLCHKEDLYSTHKFLIKKEQSRFLKKWNPVLKRETDILRENVIKVIEEEIFNDKKEIIALK